MEKSQPPAEIEQDVGGVVDRRYVLRRPIARGAVHDVFETEHGWTQVRAALKVLCDPKNAPVSLRARLLREARVLGICRHPGIAVVMDAGQCETFGPYVVTELIDGKALNNILVARATLDVESTVALGVQLADALDHVHRRGIVHRDVKPANVLVTPARPGGIDRVRLIDFGVALVPREDDVSEGKLTQHGQILGTRAYMAPEQLLGLDGIDGRSDVYSLAVILYECLSGELPFSTTASEWMQSFASGMVPAPLRGAGTTIPSALANEIRDALSLDPSKRPLTAGQFMNRCVDALGGAVPGLRLFAAPTARPDASPLLATAKPTATPEVRRRHVRAPYTSPARVVRSDGTNADGLIQDVSEGGMLLISDSAFENAESVTLKVPLPLSGKVVQVDAVARWIRRQSGQRAIGLEFVAPPDEVIADVRRYVELMSS